MRAAIATILFLALVAVTIVLGRNEPDPDTGRGAPSGLIVRPREEPPVMDPTPARAPERERPRLPEPPPVTGRAEPATPLPASPFVYEEGQIPRREQVRAAVEATLKERFEGYRLSSDEVDRVTDALILLRGSQVRLRALPVGPETAEERRGLVVAIGEATSTFNEVLDMDPAEFTAETEPEEGIDRFDPAEPVPEPEFIEGHQ